MDPFDWVSIGSITKFNKVILELKKENVPLEEETIKERFLKKGGLVIGDPASQKGVDEGEISFAVFPQEEREKIVAETKAKRAKK